MQMGWQEWRDCGKRAESTGGAGFEALADPADGQETRASAPPPADLFGHDAPARTDAERKRMRRRAASAPRGHAALPGTGPDGETCGTCRHMVRRKFSKAFLKCGLNEAAWTRGPASDIRARDAACRKWEPSPPVPQGRGG